jgi:hypothetical protein
VVVPTQYGDTEIISDASARPQRAMFTVFAPCGGVARRRVRRGWWFRSLTWPGRCGFRRCARKESGARQRRGWTTEAKMAASIAPVSSEPPINGHDKRTWKAYVRSPQTLALIAPSNHARCSAWEVLANTAGPDPAPTHGVAHNPLARSRPRYRTCRLASGDTIVTWNDSGLAA